MYPGVPQVVLRGQVLSGSSSLGLIPVAVPPKVASPKLVTSSLESAPGWYYRRFSQWSGPYWWHDPAAPHRWPVPAPRKPAVETGPSQSSESHSSASTAAARPSLTHTPHRPPEPRALSFLWQKAGELLCAPHLRVAWSHHDQSELWCHVWHRRKRKRITLHTSHLSLQRFYHHSGAMGRYKPRDKRRQLTLKRQTFPLLQQEASFSHSQKKMQCKNLSKHERFSAISACVFLQILWVWLNGNLQGLVNITSVPARYSVVPLFPLSTVNQLKIKHLLNFVRAKSIFFFMNVSDLPWHETRIEPVLVPGRFKILRPPSPGVLLSVAWFWLKHVSIGEKPPASLLPWILSWLTVIAVRFAKGQKHLDYAHVSLHGNARLHLPAPTSPFLSTETKTQFFTWRRH